MDKIGKKVLLICLGCERINVDGNWQDRDTYSDYYDLIRTHKLNDAYCPDCRIHYEGKEKERSIVKEQMMELLKN
jgi:hypothetical protein